MEEEGFEGSKEECAGPWERGCCGFLWEKGCFGFEPLKEKCYLAF